MSAKNYWSCWSCKKPVSMTMRADADGDCPHCRAELDIEDWPYPSGESIVLTPEQLDAFEKILKDNPSSDNQALKDLLARYSKWSSDK